MKRSWLSLVTVAIVLFVTVLPVGSIPQAQEKKPTAKEKMATVEYLVGSWTCGHTVGTFSGKYTTKYAKVLGDRWLKQSYDFPSGNFGDETQAAVTGEALIGYDEDRGAWVRFFATSHGEYFPIRLKETNNGWAYTYISMFKNIKEKPEADATFTKKSDTEYVIEGPTYPDNGKMVTEHHTCHKM